MKHSRIFKLLALSLPLWLGACGFHLRGPVAMPAELSPLFVRHENAPALAQEVGAALQEQGVALAASAKEARLRVILRNQRADRRVLSVSALSGKQEEIELSQQVELELRKADGTVLLAPQTLRLERDFSFDENAVLAKASEEQMLSAELQRDLVAEVLRRIQASHAQ